MNFGFTEEQELLRAEVRKFLDQNCPLEEVRKLSETPEGFSRSLWEHMAELGWVGLAVPEARGGVGLGWVDLVLLLEETGRTLFPSPLLSHALAVTALVRAGSEAQQQAWLPRLAEGRAIGTLAFLEASGRLDAEGITLEGRREAGGFTLHGEKRLVMDAAAADLFVVAFRTGASPQEISLALLGREGAGISVEPHTTVDPTRRMGRLCLEGAKVADEALLGPPGTGWPTLAGLLDCGAVGVTAETVGAAEAVLALTVGYARQRVQFGEPIGRFQGVKHPLAEAYVDVESVKSLCYYAAWALDEQPAEAPLAASRAKAYASEAFPRIGVEAVQLHGAIGYTWEYAAHLYLKRARWARPVFGDADHHYERIARLGAL